ncbi:acetyltransferase [Microscilla marina ATCC 23134]|uniref:Acetyltransferase n=2 Tax=Microscilla marina TaxID=1027 RepID=A1ZH63_MICM2|nr:acetyltransferase [Microscilla marina ATCC 23134]
MRLFLNIRIVEHFSNEWFENNLQKTLVCVTIHSLDHKNKIMNNDTPNRETILQSDEVILRVLTSSDVPDIARLMNNKNIWDNVRDYIPHPYTEQDGQAFVDATQTENPPLTFAITHQEALCGVIGLVRLVNEQRHVAELGYWLGEPYWGKNIMTKALKLTTDYAFQQLGIIRLQTIVFEYNTGSMRVLEKCGYTREAVCKKAIIKNENIWDAHTFALVQSD